MSLRTRRSDSVHLGVRVSLIPAMLAASAGEAFQENGWRGLIVGVERNLCLKTS